jgi:hypothetical protein
MIYQKQLNARTPETPGHSTAKSESNLAFKDQWGTRCSIRSDAKLIICVMPTDCMYLLRLVRRKKTGSFRRAFLTDGLVRKTSVLLCSRYWDCRLAQMLSVKSALWSGKLPKAGFLKTHTHTHTHTHIYIYIYYMCVCVCYIRRAAFVYFCVTARGTVRFTCSNYKNVFEHSYKLGSETSLYWLQESWKINYEFFKFPFLHLIFYKESRMEPSFEKDWLLKSHLQITTEACGFSTWGSFLD